MTKLKIWTGSLWALILLLASPVAAHSQDEIATVDTDIAQAVALYPDSVRTALHLIAGHSELFDKVVPVNIAASKKAATLIQKAPKTDRPHLVVLSRFPQLVKQLVETDCDDKSTLAEVLSGYPSIAENAAKQLDCDGLVNLKKLHKIVRVPVSSEEKALKAQNQDVQAAWRTLRMNPSLLRFLYQHRKSLEKLAGHELNEDYSRWLDSMEVELKRKKAFELLEWRRALAYQTQALTEFGQAAELYSNQMGYPPVGIFDTPLDHFSLRYLAPADPKLPDHLLHPLPLHTGYWMENGIRMQMYNFPSGKFITWLLDDPEHFTSFPHFIEKVLRHEIKMGNGVSDGVLAVRKWKEVDGREVLLKRLLPPFEWTSLLIEYGQFEQNFATNAVGNTRVPQGRPAFLNMVQAKYPALAGLEPPTPLPPPSNGPVLSQENTPPGNKDIGLSGMISEAKPTKWTKTQVALDYHRCLWQNPRGK